VLRLTIYCLGAGIGVVVTLLVLNFMLTFVHEGRESLMGAFWMLASGVPSGVLLGVALTRRVMREFLGSFPSV
jgi:hypothetical protein